MKTAFLFPLAAALFLPTLSASADDFRRERGKSNDAAKDALEGKPAPAFIDLAGWMNTEGEDGLKLTDLVGKVVIIDFWGTW